MFIVTDLVSLTTKYLDRGLGQNGLNLIYHLVELLVFLRLFIRMQFGHEEIMIHSQLLIRDVVPGQGGLFTRPRG